MPFIVDSDLHFLSAARSTESTGPWPFEFMLQVAFTSSPGFLTDGKDPDTYRDESPWKYPRLKEFIARIVLGGVQADSEHRMIFSDVREFMPP